MTELERIMRAILGQSAKQLNNFHELTPTQMGRAVELIQAGESPELIADAAFTLRRYRWFREAGINKAPWDLSEWDWAWLIESAPWQKKEAEHE